MAAENDDRVARAQEAVFGRGWKQAKLPFFERAEEDRAHPPAAIVVEPEVTSPPPRKYGRFTEGITLPPLRPYQLDAVQAFLRRGKGTIVLPTGTGKTYVAIELMKLLDGKIAVVVPTIQLIHQWAGWLRECGAEDVGVYYGETKQNRTITIFTYQTAYKIPLVMQQFDFVIFDEAHHLKAPEFSKLLDHTSGAKYRLGLSATMPKRGTKAREILYHIPILYDMSIATAKEKGYVSPIEVIAKQVSMSSQEREDYDKYSDAIRRSAINIGTFNMTEWQKRAKGGDKSAIYGLAAISKRRMLLAGVEAKKDAVLEVIRQSPDEMTLLFSESIKSIEKVANHLRVNGFKAEIFHSKLSKLRRVSLLRTWGDTFNILLSVRALEEGIDVPDVSVGIIMASGSGMRQLVQRIGRIVRPKPGKVAKIHVVYCPMTTEDRVLSEVRRAVETL